tara:strand:+ start:39 stop:296 length:258 start_codon:yes stop_codon:yes gene_type:complete
MYEILFTDKAYRQLKKLDEDTQDRILTALDRIKIRPESYVRKLVGDPGYRFRVGDYRLILDIDKGKLIVLVLKIGHRKKIYKRRS